jgi:large conductance mechanosensitive channel
MLDTSVFGNDMQTMKALLEEFKAFAMRGNVVDLAVAVVIGAAFGKIVSSLVDDIIMPVIGLMTGGVDFSELAWTMKAASATDAAVTMNYGVFINNIVTFVIVAFAIFVVAKGMNRLKKREAQAPQEPPKLTKDQELLVEIRDLLQRK